MLSKIQARQENERVLRTATKTRLSAKQIRDILAFGARDADVETAMTELAEVVRTQLLPPVESRCEEAVTRFGLERPPDGLQSMIVAFPLA